MHELIERIKKQRQSNPPLFISEVVERPIPLPPPVTLEEIAVAEAQLGFRLPELLRQLYIQVGNGGFGPNYGILGITAEGWKDEFNDTALSGYLSFVSSPYHNESYIGLLPFCYYGCAEHVYLDCTIEEGQVVMYPVAPLQKVPTLQEWLEQWLDAGGRAFILIEDWFEDDGSSKSV